LPEAAGVSGSIRQSVEQCFQWISAVADVAPMKDLVIRILVWSWIASLFGAVIAIYVASWTWTLAIVAYAIVTMIVAGIIRASSRTGTTKQTPM
jgi:hypothetical protein